jgi:hypothetical protein
MGRSLEQRWREVRGLYRAHGQNLPSNSINVWWLKHAIVAKGVKRSLEGYIWSNQCVLWWLKQTRQNSCGHMFRDESRLVYLDREESEVVGG